MICYMPVIAVSFGAGLLFCFYLCCLDTGVGTDVTNKFKNY
ncbi:hypothetical protein MuYL_3848 [Mucilaginibacter xinganensis]|uniref:Uncharacterized protein n=1 Tax=Mucilaginibacter xinganensis TaxID=1234841 RepID=A0A223P0T2_9SPHI|nr:hypothetical protein MuYL_3848 [Mucilaginibacter xinganensis]